MINGARQLPIQHITIRVPWHDSGWNGTICKNPCANTACTVLPRIAVGRDDAFETEHAGESIENLNHESMPPCVDEHGTFMADLPQSMIKNHPYRWSSVHEHFAPTPFTIRPYSVAAVPFRWMLKENVEGKKGQERTGKAQSLKLEYSPDAEARVVSKIQEKSPKFSTAWVQQGQNQLILLDTFFSAVRPDQSLVFLYAKRTPLSDDHRRVIIGVGRVKSIGSATEYRYTNGTKTGGKIDGYLWERNIEHSIRPDGFDGILLPYNKLMEMENTEAIPDLQKCIAFAPEEFQQNYSYGSELLPQDGAIASLIALENAIKTLRDVMEGPWDEYLSWIDKELNRLWKVRGAFPGLGPALNAFGVPHGNLLAWYIAGNDIETEDPWPKLTKVFENPGNLPGYLIEGLGPTFRDKWKALKDTRRSLLMLLARFNLTDDQAMRWFHNAERLRANINLPDKDILSNPYLIFEHDRIAENGVAFDTIDRGLFPPENLRLKFPVPEPSLVAEAIDRRRVRAVMIQTLEDAAVEGHSYLPEEWVIDRVRSRAMNPPCPLDMDTMPLVERYLSPFVQSIELADDKYGYQLDRYIQTSELIRRIIEKRKTATLIKGDFDWRKLVDDAIDSEATSSPLSESDELARAEKSLALQTIYQSRVSVLMGAAGTGKSTLLKALCNMPEVREGRILLLAPTGKARVRLEQTSGMMGKGKTIAQFLSGLQRYDGSRGRYFMNSRAEKSASNKTLIIDECSMLTEDQLAAVLDGVKGVQRLILVGDPKQLPPIGAGRPYVDIVEFLKPSNIESVYPKVGPSFAELTVTMRQNSDESATDRADVSFANVFAGGPSQAGSDEVWHEIATGKSPFVKLVRWNNPGQLQQHIFDEIVEELELTSLVDQVGFETSLGGFPSKHNGKIYTWFNTQFGSRHGAAKKCENWQILSPVRQQHAGVLAINRAIQKQFRRDFLDMAQKTGYQKIIPRPAGPEEIIYGDKVINVTNSGRRKTYPVENDAYIANGDIGIVTGHRRTEKKPWDPNEIEVEFASQIGYSYKYSPWEFDSQESSPPLELAYALTVHKTQGSEFGKTFVILPNPCRILSRELLYTALTRHKEKIVIFHQGEFKDLMSFSHETASETSKRMTNLFKSSNPVEIQFQNRSTFLDKNLIYQTSRGDLVRSKSEWIIADKLSSAGIDYQYEQSVVLDGIERYPDFTIIDDDTGSVWYWEHNGMMGNSAYHARWQQKLSAYRASGVLLHSEGGGPKGTLLTTEEKTGADLDVTEIQKNIELILGKA